MKYSYQYSSVVKSARMKRVLGVVVKAVVTLAVGVGVAYAVYWMLTHV